MWIKVMEVSFENQQTSPLCSGTNISFITVPEWKCEGYTPVFLFFVLRKFTAIMSVASEASQKGFMVF